MRTRVAVAPVAVLAVLVVGLAGCDPVGRVGTVGVGREGARLSIALDGRVTRAGAYPRRRVVTSPDGRWRAVFDPPGLNGSTTTVAIGRNRPAASLRIVERHLYVGSGGVQWSPDSRWLAMSVHVPQLLSAVAVATDGRRRVLAAPFCGDLASGYAWAPHGHRIALGATAPGIGCASGIDLWIRRAGGGRRRVIAHGISGVPSWSADRRWIATSGGTVEIMRADGSRRRGFGYGIASWSTHGETLALVTSPVQALTIGPPEGPRVRWDTRIDPGVLPVFSPDGRLLAYFAMNRIVVRRVADGRVIARVPVQGVAVLGLSWAPGSRSLLMDAVAVSPD